MFEEFYRGNRKYLELYFRFSLDQLERNILIFFQLVFYIDEEVDFCLNFLYFKDMDKGIY